MRVICCDPPGEILPIVNTLDPRITVEEDEGCAATPELTLVATVTVVLPTEAAVRPAMLTITPRAVAEPSFLIVNFTALGTPGTTFIVCTDEELVSEEIFDNEDNEGEEETASSITFPLIVKGTVIISDLKCFCLSSVTLT